MLEEPTWPCGWFRAVVIQLRFPAASSGRLSLGLVICGDCCAMLSARVTCLYSYSSLQCFGEYTIGLVPSSINGIMQWTFG